MKCLSVRQPWAWALLAGRIKTEFLCWATDYRGDLLIHAGEQRGEWEQEQLATFGRSAPRWDKLPFGQVIGLMELWACDRGPNGEWVWRLRNPRPVEPFPFAAGPRLFDVPDRQVRLASSPEDSPPAKRTRSRGRRQGRDDTRRK